MSFLMLSKKFESIPTNTFVGTITFNITTKCTLNLDCTMYVLCMYKYYKTSIKLTSDLSEYLFTWSRPSLATFLVSTIVLSSPRCWKCLLMSVAITVSMMTFLSAFIWAFSTLPRKLQAGS